MMGGRRIELRREHRQKKKVPSRRGVRLNFDVELKLKKWAQRYAAKTPAGNLSELVRGHLELLREHGGGNFMMLFLKDDLRRWLKEYAAQKCTSSEQVIVDFLVGLRESERGDGIEQI